MELRKAIAEQKQRIKSAAIAQHCSDTSELVFWCALRSVAECAPAMRILMGKVVAGLPDLDAKPRKHKRSARIRACTRCAGPTSYPHGFCGVCVEELDL